jgi:hypothetical protein
MSERIYTCLLRLFPSAFRRQYHDEALRLYRDRLRDERGFLRRLRLIVDLITDIARALPLAYTNSYSEVARSATHPSRSDGVPSFQALQEEPLQRGAIPIATVFAVSAFATFRFVIGLPNPYFSQPQHGPISPIQSVIKHLNQPISPDSVENNGDSSASQASPGAARSEARPSPMSALPSAGPSTRAGSMVNQPAQPREQNPDASYSNQRSSLAAVPPSPSAKGQSKPIREAERSATSAYASTRSPAVAVADLSGRWSMSFGAADGGPMSHIGSSSSRRAGG